MHFFKVAAYPIIILLANAIVYNDFKKYCNGKQEKRISLKSIFIISIIVGIYSLSFNHRFWWGDVSYYNAFFSNGESYKGSYGLDFIFTILHCFTTNIDVLLFTISSLSTFTILTSYGEYDEANPISVTLLFFSTFFIETSQVNLKQAVACGLASITINSYLKRDYIKSFIATVLSSLFHVTAIAILPLSILAVSITNVKNKHIKNTLFIMLLLSFIFFDKFFLILSELNNITPGLSEKMIEYSDSTGHLESKSTSIIALKGIPYYLITFYGFLYRKKIRHEIKNYDGFLTISLLASATYFLSYYSYWMSRIVNYYWMTIFVFLGIIASHLKIKSNEIIVKYSVGGLLLFFTIRQIFQMYLPQYAII